MRILLTNRMKARSVYVRRARRSDHRRSRPRFYQTNECISLEMVDRIQQERKHPDKFKWLAESTDDRGAADYGKRL